MAAFRFRLQRVLDVYVHRADAGRVDLAAAMARRDEAARRLEVAREGQRAGRAELAERQRAGVPAWEWAVYQDFLTFLDRRAEVAAGELAAREDEVQARRAALIEALREQRSIEALRRRAWERHRLEEATAERRFLDEVSAARWQRQAPSLPSA